MLETLAQAALRTLLLAAAVQLGLWLFRVRRAQLRLAAWTVVLAASLAMPAIQWATPLRLAVFPSLPESISIDAPTLQPQAVPQRPGPALLVQENTVLPTVETSWLEGVYLSVTGVLLLRLILGFVLSLRLLAKTGVSPDWDVDGRVRISPDISAPVTVANVILLPADAVGWPEPTRRAVIAHEAAHVARWDFAMLLASQLNRAVFWFNPLSWWLHRQLVGLAELASDERALEVTGDRAGYAEILLDMGRRSGPLLRGVAMARQATLRYRIEYVLSDRTRPGPVSRVRWAAVAIGAAGLSVAAASTGLNSDRPSNLAVRSSPLAASPPQQTSLASAEDKAALPAPVTADTPEPPLQPPPLVKAVPIVPPKFAPPAPRATPAFRVAARPKLHPAPRNASFEPPLRAVRQVDKRVSEHTRPERLLDVQANRSASTPLRVNGGSFSADKRGDEPAESGRALTLDSVGRLPTREPLLLRRIGDQTCTGIYLPAWGGGVSYRSLYMIRAHFFQGADGRPWLTFHFGPETMVNLPVTVTGSSLEFTGIQDTVFAVSPRGANHLTGTTQHPYGTIDFTCDGSNFAEAG